MSSVQSQHTHAEVAMKYIWNLQRRLNNNKLCILKFFSTQTRENMKKSISKFGERHLQNNE